MCLPEIIEKAETAGWAASVGDEYGDGGRGGNWVIHTYTGTPKERPPKQKNKKWS